MSDQLPPGPECDERNIRIVVYGAPRVNLIHGLAKRGKRGPLYRCWEHIKQRCLNQSDPYYAAYGGRGITICDEWLHDPKLFVEYIQETLGPRPNGHSLDRIDNNAGYAPGNLRWANAVEQGRNTRRSRLLEAFGQCMTISEWASSYGMSDMTLHCRLKRGWTVEDALTVPVSRHYGRKGAPR